MKAAIVRAFSKNGLYLLAALLALCGLVAVLMLLPVWKLNRRSLATSRQLVALDLQPGWWLQPASEPICTPLAELASSRTFLQARDARMTGVYALACGERTQAATFLQQAETVLSADKSLSLFLAAATDQLAGPGSRGENTISAGWGTVLNKAQLAYDAERREEAADWLDTILPEISAPATADRQSLYFWSCHMYRGARRLDEALLACRNLVEVSPRDSRAWLSLGLTLRVRKQPAEAAKAFARSIELDPTLIVSRVSLGQVLLEQGRDAEAIDQFRTIVTLAPKEPWSRYFLAEHALEGGDCVAAKDHIAVAMKKALPDLSGQAEKLQQRIQEACP